MSETACRECGGVIRYPTPEGESSRWLRLLAPKVCVACEPVIEARAAECEREYERAEAASRKADRVRKWLIICPARYQNTNPAQVPERLMVAAAEWQFGERGLGIVGPTGQRKTRAMFLLLHRLYVDEGRRVAYLTTSEFSHKVSRLSSEKMEQLDEFIGNLCTVPILFMDDLGKGRMTDRVESEFYHVIEERYKNLKPILFTANGTASQLAGLMGEDRGAAVMRRLSEMCEVIKCPPVTTAASARGNQ